MASDFISNVEASITSRGIAFTKFYNANDIIQRTAMKLYGSVFLNRSGIMPPRVVFPSAEHWQNYFKTLKTKNVNIGGRTVSLQTPAAESIERILAKKVVLQLKTDGNPAGRDYDTVQQSWDSEVKTSIEHYRNHSDEKKRLTKEEIAILSKPGTDQVKKVLELEEKRKMYFHPDRDRTLAVYVAIPGASQHLTYLALDVQNSIKTVDKKRVENETVDDAMEAEGWFRTVYQDRPHYTYVGVTKAQMTSLGHTAKTWSGIDFYSPNYQ